MPELPEKQALSLGFDCPHPVMLQALDASEMVLSSAEAQELARGRHTETACTCGLCRIGRMLCRPHALSPLSRLRKHSPTARFCLPLWVWLVLVLAVGMWLVWQGQTLLGLGSH